MDRGEDNGGHAPARDHILHGEVAQIFHFEQQQRRPQAKGLQRVTANSSIRLHTDLTTLGSGGREGVPAVVEADIYR